ncbi:integrase core domain-containing protein [Trueperella pyogenes]
MIHHSDRGSQYVSIVYNERLTNAGITPSTGTVGDSYDNALAKKVNGSYKNELIHTRTWTDVLEIEIATFEWVNWQNTTRLHQALNYCTPDKVETEYWQQQAQSTTIENKANT